MRKDGDVIYGRYNLCYFKKVYRYTGEGVFTIVETVGNWGKLKSGAGWISLNYAKRI